jgi:hypothetical protein
LRVNNQRPLLWLVQELHCVLVVCILQDRLDCRQQGEIRQGCCCCFFRWAGARMCIEI